MPMTDDEFWEWWREFRAINWIPLPIASSSGPRTSRRAASVVVDARLQRINQSKIAYALFKRPQTEEELEESSGVDLNGENNVRRRLSQLKKPEHWRAPTPVIATTTVRVSTRPPRPWARRTSNDKIVYALRLNFEELGFVELIEPPPKPKKPKDQIIAELSERNRELEERNAYLELLISLWKDEQPPF